MPWKGGCSCAVVRQASKHARTHEKRGTDKEGGCSEPPVHHGCSCSHALHCLRWQYSRSAVCMERACIRVSASRQCLLPSRLLVLYKLTGRLGLAESVCSMPSQPASYRHKNLRRKLCRIVCGFSLEQTNSSRGEDRPTDLLASVVCEMYVSSVPVGFICQT